MPGAHVVVDSKAVAADVRRTGRVIDPDVRALTILGVAFLGVGALVSRTVGTSFVVPRGDDPVIGTSFFVPPLAALVGYLVLRLVSGAMSGNRRFDGRRLRETWTDCYLVLLFTLVVYVHFHIKMWVPLLNDRSFDQTFLAIDERFRGVIEPLRWLRSVGARALPVPDIWYEAAFFPTFVLAFWFHALGHRRWHYHNLVAITLIELVGPLSYLLAPAAGPFLFEDGDNARATLLQHRMYEQFLSMRRGGTSWLAANGSEYLTAPLAAMPSLHCAAIAVLAYYAVRARIAIAPLVVLAAGWIAIEAVVARWHYLVDVPAGFALAVIVIGVTNRLCGFRSWAGSTAASRPIAGSGAWRRTATSEPGT
ncbi:MAG: phosphatase PAP2 family protein [Myxococcota bacterium]